METEQRLMYWCKSCVKAQVDQPLCAGCKNICPVQGYWEEEVLDASRTE